MGFGEEGEAYINFIFDRIADWQKAGADKALPLMFSIDGASDLPEMELDHLSGYKNTKPVRIGNGAAFHVQLDIYGELMDSIYLYNKHGKPITYDQWLSIRAILGYVCTVWKNPDMSIWEVRSGQENFVYSKILLWLAFDRAIRLSEKRGFPCPKRLEWMQNRDTLYDEIMTHGYNPTMGSFIQSYESRTAIDSAVLIAPLVFFIAPNDPRFLGTLNTILKSPEKGGLTSAGMVFRYDHTKSDDGKQQQQHNSPPNPPLLSQNLLKLTLPLGVGGREGTFCMCTFWLIEALTRAGVYDTKYLFRAVTMFENMLSFANHLGIFSEEISISGEQLGNTPQAFSHLALVSAALNLDRGMAQGFPSHPEFTPQREDGE